MIFINWNEFYNNLWISNFISVLISKLLVIHILTIIFAITTWLIFVLAQEGFLFMDEGIECLETVTGIILELFIDEFELLGEDELDDICVHSHTAHSFFTLGTSNLTSKIISFSIWKSLIEKETRTILVFEVFYTTGGNYSHEFSCWMFQSNLC